MSYPNLRVCTNSWGSHRATASGTSKNYPACTQNKAAPPPEFASSMECQQTVGSALWQRCTHKQQGLKTSWRVVSGIICMAPYRLDCLPSLCLININIAVLTDRVSLISLWLQFFESFFLNALTASLGL